MNANLKRFAQQKGLTKSMGIQLSRLSGVDKSTVSAHLSGTKKLSMYHAEKYAQGLDVPVAKILDDSTFKYPIVAYVSESGGVRMREEDETDICIADNEIADTKFFAIYSKHQEIIFFYNSKLSCENTKVVGSYCYIKTAKENYLGTVIKETKTSVELFNVHTNSIVKTRYTICYPIISIHYLKHANIYKIENSI